MTNKINIEQEEAFLTNLLSETGTKIVFIKRKEREHRVFFILEENSLSKQKDILHLLESGATPKYNLITNYGYRFPEEGLLSPPARKTMAISLSIFPCETRVEPNIGTGGGGGRMFYIYQLLFVGIVITLKFMTHFMKSESFETNLLFDDDIIMNLLFVSFLCLVQILISIIDT